MEYMCILCNIGNSEYSVLFSCPDFREFDCHINILVLGDIQEFIGVSLVFGAKTCLSC